MAKCTFSKGVYTAETLFQWDYNQEVEIAGLSLAITPEVHFFHDGAEKAIVRQATMDASGVIRARVPNSLLQKPYRIHAIICIYEGTAFKSLCELRLPVQARAKPDDYVSVPEDEVYSMEALGVKATILAPGSDPTVSRYLENGEGYFVFGLPLPVSISSIERTKGNGAPGTTDTYTVTLNDGRTADIQVYNGKDGAAGVSPTIEAIETDEGTVLKITDSSGVREVPLNNRSGVSLMVELSGNPTRGYTVTLDGEAVAGDVLNEMARKGANIIGVAALGLSFTMPSDYPHAVQPGTVFQYGNAVASRAPETFSVSPTHSFEFRARFNDVDYAVYYEGGQWKGVAVSAFLTLLLTEEDGVPFFSYNGQLIASWYLSEILAFATLTNRPVFCYQKDMRFYTEDDTAMVPLMYTPFSRGLTAEGWQFFFCEQNGYRYTLPVVSMEDYAPVAEKTVAYKTAESKADDLEVDDGELFLMSAGERISAPVSLGAGPQGPPGESGVTTPVNGFFTLSVDANGDLWAHTAEGGAAPAFEYNSETGDLYYLTEQE